MPTRITFQTTEPPTANPFDLWLIATDLSPGGESLDLDNDEAAWSISLPGDTTLAQKTVTKRLDTIIHRRQAIGVAGHYLRTITPPVAEELAFDIGQAGDLTVEEDILLTTMANATKPDEAESFAFDWLSKWRKPLAGWGDTLTDYQQFMAQAVYLLKPTIRIETDIEQTLLAQTIVRADGDMQTIWHRRAAPAHMALHQQTTQLTLETRQALALFLAQVSAGAASLATKFYVTQWVALPAAFRFATDVVRRAGEDKLLARMKALQR